MSLRSSAQGAGEGQPLFPSALNSRLSLSASSPDFSPELQTPGSASPLISLFGSVERRFLVDLKPNFWTSSSQAAGEWLTRPLALSQLFLLLGPLLTLFPSCHPPCPISAPEAQAIDPSFMSLVPLGNPGLSQGLSKLQLRNVGREAQG